jgi:hypothetical protein
VASDDGTSQHRGKRLADGVRGKSPFGFAFNDTTAATGPEGSTAGFIAKLNAKLENAKTGLLTLARRFEEKHREAARRRELRRRYVSNNVRLRRLSDDQAGVKERFPGCGSEELPSQGWAARRPATLYRIDGHYAHTTFGSRPNFSTLYS